MTEPGHPRPAASVPVDHLNRHNGVRFRHLAPLVEHRQAVTRNERHHHAGALQPGETSHVASALILADADPLEVAAAAPILRLIQKSCPDRRNLQEPFLQYRLNHGTDELLKHEGSGDGVAGMLNRGYGK